MQKNMGQSLIVIAANDALLGYYNLVNLLTEPLVENVVTLTNVITVLELGNSAAKNDFFR